MICCCLLQLPVTCLSIFLLLRSCCCCFSPFSSHWVEWFFISSHWDSRKAFFWQLCAQRKKVVYMLNAYRLIVWGGIESRVLFFVHVCLLLLLSGQTVLFFTLPLTLFSSVLVGCCRFCVGTRSSACHFKHFIGFWNLDCIHFPSFVNNIIYVLHLNACGYSIPLLDSGGTNRLAIT